MPAHHYQVSAYRRVRVPEAGRYAHTHERRDWDFPFGKGKRFANGREALSAAEAFAEKLEPLASEVSIWHMIGGSGTRAAAVKDERDEMFDAGWDSVSVPTD